MSMNNLDKLINLSVKEAESELRNNGVRDIRIITPDMMVTMEYRPGRVTIIHNENNIVIDIRTG